jgi:hypothetical protein
MSPSLDVEDEGGNDNRPGRIVNKPVVVINIQTIVLSYTKMFSHKDIQPYLSDMQEVCHNDYKQIICFHHYFQINP